MDRADFDDHFATADDDGEVRSHVGEVGDELACLEKASSGSALRKCQTREASLFFDPAAGSVGLIVLQHGEDGLLPLEGQMGIGGSPGGGTPRADEESA